MIDTVGFQCEGIDMSVVELCFGGNSEVYFKFLKRFFEDKDYIRFKEGMKEKRYSEVFNSAHALKGVSGNLGMVRIYEVLVIIVEKLRHSNIEGIEKLYESFEYECNKVEESLSNVEIEM